MMRMVLRVERIERSIRSWEGGGWVLRVDSKRGGDRKVAKAIERWPVPWAMTPER